MQILIPETSFQLSSGWVPSSNVHWVLTGKRGFSWERGWQSAIQFLWSAGGRLKSTGC